MYIVCRGRRDRDTWEELGKWTRKLQKTMDEVEQVITCRTPFFSPPKRMVRIDKITPLVRAVPGYYIRNMDMVSAINSHSCR